MTFATQTLRQSVGRVLRLQTALTLTMAAIFLSGLELSAGDPNMRLLGMPPAIFNALSALYGGAVTVMSTWWLARRFERAGGLAREQSVHAQRLILAAVAQRWLLAAALLLVGLLALRLAPLPLLFGFVVAHGGYLAKVYPQS